MRSLTKTERWSLQSQHCLNNKYTTSSDEVFCVHSNNIMEDSASATFAVNLLISYWWYILPNCTTIKNSRKWSLARKGVQLDLDLSLVVISFGFDLMFKKQHVLWLLWFCSWFDVTIIQKLHHNKEFTEMVPSKETPTKRNAARFELHPPQQDTSCRRTVGTNAQSQQRPGKTVLQPLHEPSGGHFSLVSLI